MAESFSASQPIHGFSHFDNALWGVCSLPIDSCGGECGNADDALMIRHHIEAGAGGYRQIDYTVQLEIVKTILQTDMPLHIYKPVHMREYRFSYNKALLNFPIKIRDHGNLERATSPCTI